MRRRKSALYRSLIEPGVPPMPGARAALERLGRRRPLAIATNTPRDEAAIITRHLGIDALLRAVIVREDYARSKPAPDAYLAAADRLGVKPDECVVVEDTARGLGAGQLELKERTKKDASSVPLTSAAEDVRDLVLSLGGTLGARRA